MQLRIAALANGLWGLYVLQKIESRMPLSAMGIVMNLLSDDAKSKPLSFALNAFVSIYNQMRKSPYR